jgi:hypothetical protein
MSSMPAHTSVDGTLDERGYVQDSNIACAVISSSFAVLTVLAVLRVLLVHCMVGLQLSVPTVLVTAAVSLTVLTAPSLVVVRAAVPLSNWQHT